METLAVMLQALGVIALTALNIMLCMWLWGLYVSVRREREDAGLSPVVVRLTAEVARRDAVIAEQNAKLDALNAEAAAMKSHMQKCGLGFHHKAGNFQQ